MRRWRNAWKLLEKSFCWKLRILSFFLWVLIEKVEYSNMYISKILLTQTFMVNRKLTYNSNEARVNRSMQDVRCVWFSCFAGCDKKSDIYRIFGSTVLYYTRIGIIDEKHHFSLRMIFTRQIYKWFTRTSLKYSGYLIAEKKIREEKQIK